ncbi:MAG TPA: haloacid dehalogenase type II [Candidatus Binatia bacterium]|nr:haloacid dehalogenase type II [Candidatus Binatia bacterium]
MSNPSAAAIKVLAFDVFGTVVDWRSSIIAQGEQLGKTKGPNIDWAAFADAWRSVYHPSLDRVRNGELPWTKLDVLHRMSLEEILRKFKIEGLSEDEKAHFNRAWHRLTPWPDSVAGLQRLKTRFVISTLSNGNISLLTNMAKHAGLPWDCILSAENVQHYKPDREVYLLVPGLFDLKPEEVTMVAAHERDLESAQKYGLRTAFVHRPLEHGPGKAVAIPVTGKYDFVAKDFLDLADQLGV